VAAYVKKLLGVKKIGHAGTLDPFATGVLICCINKATKIARFFLHDEKKYLATLQLGVETDTQDLTGTITSICDSMDVSEKAIRSAFKQFEGMINQLPPVFSALKFKGAPLYRLARSGRPVQKPARPVFISNNKILEINLPYIRFEITCSAGTYIRTLCADIGARLGCGAHLRELKRIKSSGFTIDKAVSLKELEKLAFSGNMLGKRLLEKIISMADALHGIPGHVADESLTEKIKYGKIITKRDFMPKHLENSAKFIKIVDNNNDLLAVLSYQKKNNKYGYCCVFS